jgi:hypothetical protein
MCGASFDAPAADPMAQNWEDPTQAVTAEAVPSDPKRQSRAEKVAAKAAAKTAKAEARAARSEAKAAKSEARSEEKAAKSEAKVAARVVEHEPVVPASAQRESIPPPTDADDSPVTAAVAWLRSKAVPLGVVAGVLVVGFAGLTWYRNRPLDLHWSSDSTPLGTATMKVAGTCRSITPGTEDDVLVSAQLCSLGDSASLVVIDFNFRSRDLSQVEPRFLVETLMSGSDGVQSGAIDTYTPGTSKLGKAGDFTGRALVDGSEVQTVGQIVTTGNRGVIVFGAAPDREKVVDAARTMAASLVANA